MKGFHLGLEFEADKGYFDVDLMKAGDILRFAGRKEYVWLVSRNFVHTSCALNKKTIQLNDYTIKNEMVYFNHPVCINNITDRWESFFRHRAQLRRYNLA